MEKTSSFNFSFNPTSEYYDPVFISFNCTDEYRLQDLIRYFRRFALVLGYAEESINKYSSEDEI